MFEKLDRVDGDIQRLLSGERIEIPFEVARDVTVLRVKFHPKKTSVDAKPGQARLLHDLASIELQALELAVRSLAEFPDADPIFRQELAEIARGEAKHLRLCLQGIETLGHRWGDWPVHTALWHSVGSDDSLLDRLLIVHRYLEGSGLDAGDSILRRLSGVESRVVREVVNIIVTEEIGHVQFGSNWYRHYCRAERLEPDLDFPLRLRRVLARLPRRMEVLAKPLRREAGFSEPELNCLESLRNERLATRI